MLSHRFGRKLVTYAKLDIFYFQEVNGNPIFTPQIQSEMIEIVKDVFQPENFPYALPKTPSDAKTSEEFINIMSSFEPISIRGFTEWSTADALPSLYQLKKDYKRDIVLMNGTVIKGGGEDNSVTILLCEVIKALHDHVVPVTLPMLCLIDNSDAANELIGSLAPRLLPSIACALIILHFASRTFSGGASLKVAMEKLARFDKEAILVPDTTADLKPIQLNVGGQLVFMQSSIDYFTINNTGENIEGLEEEKGKFKASFVATLTLSSVPLQLLANIIKNEVPMVLEMFSDMDVSEETNDGDESLPVSVEERRKQWLNTLIHFSKIIRLSDENPSVFFEICDSMSKMILNALQGQPDWNGSSFPFMIAFER